MIFSKFHSTVIYKSLNRVKHRSQNTNCSRMSRIINKNGIYNKTSQFKTKSYNILCQTIIKNNLKIPKIQLNHQTEQLQKRGKYRVSLKKLHRIKKKNYQMFVEISLGKIQTNKCFKNLNLVYVITFLKNLRKKK